LIYLHIEKSGLFSGAVAQVSLRFSLDDQKTLADSIHVPIAFKATSAKRRTEFFAGRYALQEAFLKLGVQLQSPIESRADRSLQIPAEFVASITHTGIQAGYFASAVVARSSDVFALGLDSERVMNAKSSETVKRSVLLTEETEIFQNGLNSSISEELFSTLVFSAKESLYKALYPKIEKYFDFNAAKISAVNVEKGKFEFELTRDLNLSFTRGFRGHGRFAVDQDLVHTGIELSHMSIQGN